MIYVIIFVVVVVIIISIYIGTTIQFMKKVKAVDVLFRFIE